MVIFSFNLENRKKYMILFREDWDKYPSAIIDTETNNKSFLRLATLYRDMGVKNHSFILSLLNPSLQGLDPFDPNLTTEQMLLMSLEAKENFWWFLRECCKVPESGSRDGVYFRANRGAISLFWLFFNNITLILEQIRQTGKTLSTCVLFSYLLNIRYTNTEVSLITKDDDLRGKTVRKVKDTMDELPFFLNLRSKKDLANTEEISINRKGNRYKGYLPNRSPKAALNLARGITSPTFHIDEAASIYNIGISLPAALAAGTAARDIFRKNNIPYGTILTTTAGKKDDPDGRYVYNMVIEAAMWSEHLFDVKNLEELEKVIRKNSPKGKLRVYCPFIHRQLGYTDEWLKKTIEEANSFGEDADRDFFGRWTSGTQSSPILPDMADKIRSNERRDFRTEIDPDYGYITRWYKTEDEINRMHSVGHFILSLDSSDAVGKDDIALTIRYDRTGEIVAAGNYNETNLITFCKWLVKWFVNFNNLTAIIERRSTGMAIIDYIILHLLSLDIDPFKRMFNRVVNDRDEYPDRFNEINKPMYVRNTNLYDKYKKLFGFATSGTGLGSRTELYSTVLLNAVKYTGDKIYDSIIINQLLSLETKNGRIDHADGEHDDSVISWLLSHWLITKGRHLDYYGINSRNIFIDNTQHIEYKDSDEFYDQKEQFFIRKEIEEIAESIKNERDPFIITNLESKLRFKASKLKLKENEIFSIDDLIKSLRENKKINNMIDNNQRFYNHFGYRGF